MERITEKQASARLNAVKGAMLAGAAFVFLVTTILPGFSAISSAFAQPAMQRKTDTSGTIAERRAEQALPRSAAPFDPVQFDKYVGYYELSPVAVFNIHRDGDHFLARLTGQQDLEVFPESENKFFYTVVAAQISFEMDASGRATGLVLHQNGLEQRASRIDEAAARNLEATLAERVKNHTRSPGTEAALREQLQGLEIDRPDFMMMTPSLAAEAKSQLKDSLAAVKPLGPIKTIAFKTVGPGGFDVYEVTFARGSMEWRIAPLNADGKIYALNGRREYAFKHLVDIGGARRLNLVCNGKGSPTVVFLQGAGSNITAWRMIREPVSAFTRACFYDRAGFGYSDPSDEPATANNVADDLHALLRAAGINGRVVLVGHSLGGLFATLYADKFLSSVAGMVLVDPSFAGQFDYTVSQQDKDIMDPQNDQWAASMHTCLKLAQEGGLSKNDNHNCFPHVNAMPNETEYLMHQFLQPNYYASILSEDKYFDPLTGGTATDGDQERQLRRDFGNIPLEVLTAGLTFKDSKLSDAWKKARADNWKKGHDELAQRSTRGESILVPDSNHFIQFDQPDRVVTAIRKVVMESRHP